MRNWSSVLGWEGLLSSFLPCTSRLHSIRRQHPPQRAVLSHNRSFGESKVVMSWARYTLATELNSTRSTLWEVDKVIHVAVAPYTLATELKGVQHSGNKVDRVGDNVDREKLSNLSCCRFVAKISNKVHCIGDSRLCCRFVASSGNSRL